MSFPIELFYQTRSYFRVCVGNRRIGWCTLAEHDSATQPTHLTPPAVKHISGPPESYWMETRSILDPIFILDHDFEVLATSGARPDPILKHLPNVTFFMRQGSCRIVRKIEHEMCVSGTG